MRFFFCSTTKYITVMAAVLGTMIIFLTGCSGQSLIDGAGQVSQKLVDKSTSTIQGFVEDGDAPDVKFDSYSASDAVDGVGPTGEQYYFDEKSEEYVTAAQYRANHMADSLKLFWIPVSVLSFLFGFLIRRFNHSSAAIRRFGFFIEIIVPVILTIVVYVFCALADSSMVDIFDGIF